MKTSISRTISLLLTVLLLSAMLAGCSSEAGPGSPANTPAADTPTEIPAENADTPQAETPSNTPEAPAEAPEDEPANVPAEPVVYDNLLDAMNASTLPAVTLPIAEELTTITVFTHSMIDEMLGYKNLNDAPIWMEAEARTNVHFEWTLANEVSAQFSLMLVSEEFTDLAAGCSSFLTGGFDYNIEEGIIKNLADLVPVYAPHYYELLCADESTRKACYTDAGNMGALNILRIDAEPNFLGWVIREDRMKAVGFEGTPETYADWETILQGFKDNGMGGLYLGSAQMDDLGIGYGARNAYLVDDNQQVYFGAISNEYKAYLAMLSDWITKGYVEFDLANPLPWNYDFSYLYSGDYSMIYGLYTFHDLYQMYGRETDPNFNAVGIPFPTVNEEDVLSCYGYGMAANSKSGFDIIAFEGSDMTETMLQWFDYMNTYDGWLLGNYGIEGVSYNLDENGQPVFTELITAHPDGYTKTQLLDAYAMNQKFMGLYDYNRAYGGVSEEGMALIDLWDQESASAIRSKLPDITMTVEESEELGTRQSDISTYVSEYVLRVATGADDLESTWDAFVANVQAMDLQGCIDIYQAAVDRYNAR